MSAFEKGLEAMLPRLRRFAHGLAADRADADDLTQITIERALRARAQWQDGTRLSLSAYNSPSFGKGNMISSLFLIITIVVAILASFGHLSIWWAVIPAFMAGLSSLKTGHGVTPANKGGRRDRFPRTVATYVGISFALAVAVYGIAQALG